MQKQTNPEPLGAPMAKMILVVAIIVSLGAVLGAAGYLMSNKPQVNPSIAITPAPSEEITVSTDKTEYEQGETVGITVKNNLDKSIWYIKEPCPSSCCNLHKWEDDKWENLGSPMSCIYVSRPPQGKSLSINSDELKLDGEIKKQWDTKLKGELAESGNYRFSFYYGLSEESYTEKTIYSNEFTIKGKTSEILTIDYVLKHSEELTNKTISVKGTANNKRNKVICAKGPGCNQCDSPLILEEEGQSIEISGRINNTPVICTGTDCEGIKECKPLTKDKSYIVTGIWNGRSLDIETWVEKSAVDPRCGQKVKGDGICDVEIKGIEFDTNTEKCVEVYSSGCKLVNIPFQTIEECQKVCERGPSMAKTCTIEIPKDMKLQSLSRYDVKTNDTAFKSLTVSDNLCLNSYASSESGYYLVQYDGPITEDEKKQIESLGGKPYGYVPQNSFIYKMDETIKNKVQALKFIKWIGIYQPAFRIAPSISDEMIKSDSKQILDVSIFDANYKDIVSKIEKLGGTAEYKTEEYLRVVINASKIPDIARINDVVWIALYTEPKLF